MGKAIINWVKPDPASYCTKKQYASKEEAKAGLKRVQSYPNPDNQPRPINVYRCRKNPGCGQWHLTKQPKRKGSE